MTVITFLTFGRRKRGYNSGQMVLFSPRRETGVTHTVLAPRSFRWRFFAWKIGPLSFLLPSSRARQLHPSSMKAAEHGFSPATASVAWHCSGFSLTSSPTSSPTSSGVAVPNGRARPRNRIACLHLFVRDSGVCLRVRKHSLGRATMSGLSECCCSVPTTPRAT